MSYTAITDPTHLRTIAAWLVLLGWLVWLTPHAIAAEPWIIGLQALATF